MEPVTIYTIAKELNMTPSMVSRAFDPNGRIREEKRKLVLETARKYNFSPNRFASRMSMKTIQIGVLINSKFDVNTDKMRAGIELAHAILKDYKIHCDVTVLNSDENVPEDYSAVLHRYAHCDGVILSGMSAEKYTDMLRDLCRINPNVVQVQAVNENIPHLFSSRHDETVAAKMAAEFLYQCLRKAQRKNVLLFTGDRQSALHASAQMAFSAACCRLGLCLLDSVDMQDRKDYFTQNLPEIMERYGDKVDGIYITSGISEPLCEFLKENGLDPVLVAFDTHPNIKQYMDSGVIAASIDQNVEGQMQRAFETLVQYIISGRDCPKTIWTDVQLMLKSNMHQFN